jgi:predicted peptidase
MKMLRNSAAWLATCMFVIHPATADESQLGAYNESASVIEIAGEDFARNFASVISADSRIDWEVYVPDTYDSDVPAGVIVYISPSNSGKIPQQWQSVIEAQNLIWVSANKSGNRINPRLRITYSLLAPAFIDKNYEIDSNRIYIAGLSGGGRVASIVAPEYPTLFRGAIYICGVNDLDRKSREQRDRIRSSRFVFLTGSDDFNQRETKRVHKAYRRAGIEDSYYLEVLGMGHENPDAERFAEAIAYLDKQ